MSLFYFFFLVLNVNASMLWNNDQGIDKAQEVIDKAIEIHGGDVVSNSSFEFDFRKYHYTYFRNGGQFEFSRKHIETGLKDILNNDGFKRVDQGKDVPLTSKKARSYSNSVNSVQYFAFLPYYLNDQAVNKKYIGEVVVKGTTYHKIEVTFDQEGGGDDHDDKYVYWFDAQDHSLDFLAYSFHVNGGGVRFREAFNTRTIGGVVFQDYVNYKHDKNTPVESLDELFEKGELIELSKIELKNIIKTH